MKTPAVSCRAVRRKLLFAQERPTPDLDAHLSLCPDCRTFAETLTALTTVGRLSRERGVSPKVAQEAHRRAAAILSTPTVIPSVAWSGIWARATLIASISLFLLVIGLWTKTKEKTEKPDTRLASTVAFGVLPPAAEREIAEALTDTIHMGMKVFLRSFGTVATDDFGARISFLSLRMAELRQSLEGELGGEPSSEGQM